MTVDKYGNEILSNYYISNCLIEAVKAKLKCKDIIISTNKIKG